MTTPAATAPGSDSLVAAEFGITMGDRGSPVGLTMAELIQVGLRRNPRRAQLLVSTVLGKHLPADPRLIAGVGRLLGALVGRTLAGDSDDVPASWTIAARAAVSGSDPAALLTLMETVGGSRAFADQPLLTFGFAETATSVGHLVADQLRSDYLHSTRRRDGSIPITADFTEPHSHATGHLLRPEQPGLLFGAGTVVLVDDELSTGRTALNVIEAMHALAPRSRYVLAGIVDVRSQADDEIRAEVAGRLGCRIDVVSVVSGEITVPAATVDRVAAEVAAHEPVSTVEAGGAGVRQMELPWPVQVPHGGRHGFLDDDRDAFDSAVESAASVVSEACGGARRVLVLGTEELMYLPLRLALALAADPTVGRHRAVAFQSTTRSPVHAIDRPGYPIRRRIDFQSSVLGTNGDSAGRETRHVYNCNWPEHMTGGIAGNRPDEPDLIVVVDDGHALPGPTGLADALAAATGTPVLLAVLTPAGATGDIDR